MPRRSSRNTGKAKPDYIEPSSPSDTRPETEENEAENTWEPTSPSDIPVPETEEKKAEYDPWNPPTPDHMKGIPKTERHLVKIGYGPRAGIARTWRPNATRNQRKPIGKKATSSTSTNPKNRVGFCIK